MTYQEVATMVASIGIPYAYFSFPNNQAPQLPYCVYYYPNRDDMNADNTNYVKIETLVIEAYTEHKDFTLEETIESVLTQNGINYDKSETFINQENMFQLYYESEVIINANEQSQIRLE